MPYIFKSNFTMKNIRKYLKRIPLVSIPYRIHYALKYYIPKIILIFKWSVNSKEIGTFTYKLTDNNVEYLLHNISIITNLPFTQIENYYKEIYNDDKLKSYVINKIKNSQYKSTKDERCDFGSRIAYYCIIRAIKPKIVVENGVELGYTGIVLCSALLKNKSEGISGIYYGFDIDPNAGLLIRDELYNEIAYVITGESLETLAAFKQPIDFYFSDGERSLSYENEEFKLLQHKMTEFGVVVSNKLQFSNATAQFAKLMNKKLIYFREDPLNHWYPGSQIGIVF